MRIASVTFVGVRPPATTTLTSWTSIEIAVAFSFQSKGFPVPPGCWAAPESTNIASTNIASASFGRSVRGPNLPRRFCSPDKRETGTTKKKVTSKSGTQVSRCVAAIKPPVSVKLHCRQSNAAGNVVDTFGSIIHEHPDFFHLGRQLPHNLSGSFRINLARAFLVKHEPQRVGTRVDSRQRILQIRDSANLDPGHRPSCQSSGKWIFTFCHSL